MDAFCHPAQYVVAVGGGKPLRVEDGIQLASDESFQIGGRHSVDWPVAVRLQMDAHQAVRVLGFVLDVGSGGKVTRVLQQAHRRLLLCPAAAQAGGILVVCVGWGSVRNQGDGEFPAGQILHRCHGEAKISVDFNVHNNRCLWWIVVF